MTRIEVAKRVIAVFAGAALGLMLMTPGAMQLQEVQGKLVAAQSNVSDRLQEIVVLRDGAEKLLARKTVLEKEHAVLMTKEHTEALRVWSTFGEVCRKQSFADLSTDAGCSTKWWEAFKTNQPFPTPELRLEILKDPAKALRLAKEFLKDRCPRAQIPRPNICFEAEYRKTEG